MGATAQSLGHTLVPPTPWAEQGPKPLCTPSCMTGLGGSAETHRDSPAQRWHPRLRAHRASWPRRQRLCASGGGQAGSPGSPGPLTPPAWGRLRAGRRPAARRGVPGAAAHRTGAATAALSPAGSRGPCHRPQVPPRGTWGSQSCHQRCRKQTARTPAAARRGAGPRSVGGRAVTTGPGVGRRLPPHGQPPPPQAQDSKGSGAQQSRPAHWGWGCGQRLTSKGCRLWSEGAVEGAEPFSALLRGPGQSAPHSTPCDPGDHLNLPTRPGNPGHQLERSPATGRPRPCPLRWCGTHPRPPVPEAA